MNKTHRKKQLGEPELDKVLERQVLHERARRLAAPPPQEKDEKEIPFVEFQLADESYAIECRYIDQILPLKKMVPIPGTPPFIAGIMNVRGKILSLVDLGKLFQLPGSEKMQVNRVIIICTPDREMEFGILAETIADIITIVEPQIQAPQPNLPTLTGLRRKYLQGIFNWKNNQHRIILLDAGKLLADPDLIVEPGPSSSRMNRLWSER